MRDSVRGEQKEYMHKVLNLVTSAVVISRLFDFILVLEGGPNWADRHENVGCAGALLKICPAFKKVRRKLLRG